MLYDLGWLQAKELWLPLARTRKSSLRGQLPSPVPPRNRPHRWFGALPRNNWGHGGSLFLRKVPHLKGVHRGFWNVGCADAETVILHLAAVLNDYAM